VYQFRNEQYCVGFASCNSNEKSLSSKKLQNGVWSYFLIKALSGEADGIYREGLLFSDALQRYLNKETSSFVKLNVVGKPDQTPIKFGNETDTFVIADLSSLLFEKIANTRSDLIRVDTITIYSGTYGQIYTLPGFNKKNHRVPNYFSSSTNSFVKEKGKNLVEEEISNIGKALISKLKYRRTDISSTTDKGTGSIETVDFDYSIELSQDDSNPDQYCLIRRLESIANQQILENTYFNEIFDRHFDSLAFFISRQIDLAVLIDKIEMLKDSPISVEYDPSSIDMCFIKIRGCENKIEVNPDNISISLDYKTSPSNLLNELKNVRKGILARPELRLIPF
jgi:hypothetical protein